MLEHSVDDVFEKVDYEGSERPEYILKNGRAFNVYAALKYIQEQQKQIKYLAGKEALINEMKREINLNHHKDSDPMFVSGWDACAKRIDDFF